MSFQTSAVLCAGGCALLALSSLLAIVAVLLPGGACERRVCTLAGYMQTAAGKSRGSALWGGEMGGLFVVILELSSVRSL